MADNDATLWQAQWDLHFNEAKKRSPEYDPKDYYTSGRKSKAWPDKETPEWWAENGPKFVAAWGQWVKHNGLEIWEYPDSETGELKPAIELEVYGVVPADDRCPETRVRSFIDRVFVNPAGELVIVDLKTGSFTPPWPLQLALNNLGLRDTFDVKATKAGFWKAREGGVPTWHDLTIYEDEWLHQQVRKARLVRDNQLFLASPNNLCKSACGVSQFCAAMGGRPFFRKDATMTHNTGR